LNLTGAPPAPIRPRGRGPGYRDDDGRPGPRSGERRGLVGNDSVDGRGYRGWDDDRRSGPRDRSRSGERRGLVGNDSVDGRGYRGWDMGRDGDDRGSYSMDPGMRGGSSKHKKKHPRSTNKRKLLVKRVRRRSMKHKKKM
jgi:hypothetical protein